MDTGGIGHWAIFFAPLSFCAARVSRTSCWRARRTMQRIDGRWVLPWWQRFLLVWVNAAVGMIGDDNPANVLYGGVIAVGILGAIIARQQPHGMARTLCVMAMVQMVVPVLALILWPTDFAPGVVGVFVLNGVYAALWLLSAWLFRKAAREHTPAGAAP
jgi:hypothetical protein